MKILVCIKQVIDTSGTIKIDSAGQWVSITPATNFDLNRFDEYAVEEALKIKETIPGTTIDILTVGPARALAALKRAQGLGADHGIHLLTGGEGYVSPFAIAAWIASVAQNRKYDLILTGVMSEDEMQGQVGPTIAALLKRPYATAVIFEQLSADQTSVYVEREIEGGLRDTLELKLPALLSIQTGINTPRYPKLTNMLRAKREEAEIIPAEQLNPPDQRQTVTRINHPQKLRAGRVLAGDPEEKARQLLRIFYERGIISFT
ncbi:electron transfer flavoprotein subunit beta/FixA family protein [Thermodesulfobacteriota bacterium]